MCNRYIYKLIQNYTDTMHSDTEKNIDRKKMFLLHNYARLHVTRMTKYVMHWTDWEIQTPSTIFSIFSALYPLLPFLRHLLSCGIIYKWSRHVQALMDFFVSKILEFCQDDIAKVEDHLQNLVHLIRNYFYSWSSVTCYFVSGDQKV